MFEQILEETGFIPLDRQLNNLNGILLGLTRAKERIGGENLEIDKQIKGILAKLEALNNK